MNFSIKWKQVYYNWANPVDAYIEDMLQYTDFKEALEVISKIKSLKD